MFRFAIMPLMFEWNGSRTINVYAVNSTLDDYLPVDCFSLNYGRDDYTKAEVMAHALEWMEREYGS